MVHKSLPGAPILPDLSAAAPAAPAAHARTGHPGDHDPCPRSGQGITRPDERFARIKPTRRTGPGQESLIQGPVLIGMVGGYDNHSRGCGKLDAR
jgi:hypothetical protein